jgi:aromatic ring-opening dioxygenase catalytic subunit (LigB family)
MTEQAKKARNAYMDEWRKKNRQKVRAYMKTWRTENKDKIEQYTNSYWEKRAAQAKTEA